MTKGFGVLFRGLEYCSDAPEHPIPKMATQAFTMATTTAGFPCNYYAQAFKWKSAIFGVSNLTLSEPGGLSNREPINSTGITTRVEGEGAPQVVDVAVLWSQAWTLQ